MRRHRLASGIAAGVVVTAVAIAAWLTFEPGRAQGQASALPRTAQGRPSFNGLWQAINTANWDLEAHAAKQGPVISLGAAFSVPAGVGVVQGGEIPYQDWARKKRAENAARWMWLDPEVKCYLPGIPRATYLPYPFQIVQSVDTIIMAYEFATANRIVRMNSTEESAAPTWMGWSKGRWDGDTLVIDVTDQTEETWFDRAGNHHSGDLTVTERYRFIDADTLQYEATIEDPQVFTRPWTISMPLYRRREPGAKLLEYRCVPFAEELMYGHFRRPPAP